MGVEGGFRHTCEVTMRLIRKERDSVINVLETLVNDPGVEMATFSRDTPRTYLNAQALKHIGNVKNKVRGATKSGTTGLSVEAQVFFIYLLILQLALSEHTISYFYFKFALEKIY